MRFGDPRLLERFWTKVAVTDGDCWEWNASKDQSGYGMFGIAASRCRRAHIVSYEALVATIPDGLVIDHLCRNRACVNPAHLEPVTIAENNRRGMHGVLKPRVCLHGHELPGGPGRCPTCRQISNVSANRPCRQRARKAA